MKAEPKNIRIKSQNEIISSKDKKNGFHEKYLKICKWKNIATVPEVKKRNQKNFQELDFHADRIRPIEWIAITEALRHDKSLKFIAIRLRKNTGKCELFVDAMKNFSMVSLIDGKMFFNLIFSIRRRRHDEESARFHRLACRLYEIDFHGINGSN